MHGHKNLDGFRANINKKTWNFLDISTFRTMTFQPEFPAMEKMKEHSLPFILVRGLLLTISPRPSQRTSADETLPNVFIAFCGAPDARPVKLNLAHLQKRIKIRASQMRFYYLDLGSDLAISR